eukprot:240833-Alexandrium_andersonii.AAC.1
MRQCSPAELREEQAGAFHRDAGHDEARASRAPWPARQGWGPSKSCPPGQRAAARSRAGRRADGSSTWRSA